MKCILHVLPYMGVGGTEQMVLELCRHRDRERFACRVVAPHDGVIAAEIRQTGVPVYPSFDFLNHAANGADLINLHCLGYEPSLVAAILATGKPWVVSLQWNQILPRLPALIICASEEAHRLQTHPERCVAIPNGVDPSRFQLARKVPGVEVVLTRICRPPKCAPYFWPAMQQVLDRYPKARLWIVGDPELGTSESSQVQFLGIRRDVPAILAETDLFVYTPSPTDGCQDLVTMEAAAAGVPCVVSDVPAVRPSVLSGETGFRVPFGDGDAFVQKVSLLIEDTALRTMMGQAAARLARERFDIREVAKRYETVYQETLRAYQGDLQRH